MALHSAITATGIHSTGSAFPVLLTILLAKEAEPFALML
jgi:hypothetical protein